MAGMPDTTMDGDGQTTVGDGIPGTEDGMPDGDGTTVIAIHGDGVALTTVGTITMVGILGTDTKTAGPVTAIGTEIKIMPLRVVNTAGHQDIRKQPIALDKG